MNKSGCEDLSNKYVIMGFCDLVVFGPVSLHATEKSLSDLNCSLITSPGFIDEHHLSLD